MFYQRKDLASGENIGEPAALPAELQGLSDEGLADLSAHLPGAAAQLGYAGQGFFPVPGVPPVDPPTPVRIGKYWLFQRFSQEQERAFAKLEYQARNLTPEDLDNPAKEGLFQLQRFLRRLDALTIVELDAAENLAGFELLRLLGVFGDPADPASTAALAPILAPPTDRERV